MAAPIGNKFWLARSSHGATPVFASPDDLWAACVEYFEWVEDNPLYEMKPFAYQGVVVQEAVAKMRAMTMMGLCNFLDIGTSTWADYRSRKDFSEVVARVERIMRQQKFEGASADLLNPNIIARDLGLADKQQVSGDPDSPILVQHGAASSKLAEFLNGIAERSAEAGQPSG
jgi:hypothetical protein